LDFKRDFNFAKTYATGISPWKPFIIPYKGIDADYHGTPEDINKDGKVDDADKTALSPMNLITEVHKRASAYLYTFRNETTACSVITIMTRFYQAFIN
jgi:glycerophosphoryl diester phosphodiesterase